MRRPTQPRSIGRTGLLPGRRPSRLLPLVLGLSLAGLGLAACGSDSEPTTAGGSVTTPIPGTEPATGGGTSGGAAGINPIGGGGGAIGTIAIEITRPDADPVAYTIGCLGDAFPVTPAVDGIEGAAACTRLGEAEVLERLTQGSRPDRACTEIYGGPDVATIMGELNGEPVDTTVDRANGCGISDWDDLLAGVLPPSAGVS